METTVRDLETPDRNDNKVQLWAVYYGPSIFNISFATAPWYMSENKDFDIKRKVA